MQYCALIYNGHVYQDAHHNFCNERFNDFDDQIHDIHDMLTTFWTRKNS